MSFSSEVKEELSKVSNLGNKEEIMYEFLGYLESDNIEEKPTFFKYTTESDYNIDRFAKVLRNIGIEEFEIDINGKFFVIKFKKKDFNKINYNIANIKDFKPFIRGLFMGSGSINNPEKIYHLECKIRRQETIEAVVNVMKENNIKLKQRENVIYIKEGEEISKFLAFIGARNSVLRFEEIRVERHMNNKVNRLVNCKTANLNKVLNASVEQIEAIRRLKQNGKFKNLDKELKEIAELRLEYPDASFAELGKKLSNSIGKSGVNYRLKKIIQISKEL